MSGVTHAEASRRASADFLDFTPTTGDLVQIARTSGRPGATVSTIRHWRNQGLVSAPFRHKGVWRYPIAAVGEVDLLARYGRRQLGDDLLKFARYVETRFGDPASVKGVCLRLLDPFRQGAAEAATLAAKGPEAIRVAAEEIARMRGRNAVFPREVRMSLQQRIGAHEYMLSKLLSVDLGESLEADGLAQFARGLGLQSGRGGKSRDVSEALPDGQDWELDVETLIAGVREASPELGELARRSVAMQHLWMPAMLLSLWEDIDARDVPLLRVAEEIASHQSPQMYPLVYAAAVVRKRRTLSEFEMVERFNGPDEAFSAAAALLESPDAKQSIQRLGVALRPYPRVQLRLAAAKLQAAKAAEADGALSWASES